MDWCFGNDLGDLVVPKSQDSVDKLPSPESWSKWGLTAPGNFESPYKCFVTDANISHDQLKFNGELCNNAIFGSSASVKDPSSCSSICGELSEESLSQAPISNSQPDYQLDDFASFEEMDDIFLNSLLEDLPRSEDLHGSFCISPEYQSERTPVNYLLTDALLSQSLVHPQQNSANGFVPEEISLEECVLQELEMVMSQLPDETRICFRDAFYRLAKNSEQNAHESLNVGAHSRKWTISHDKPRSGKKESTESKTNTIDRAIANLTFNKIDTNVRDFPTSTANPSRQNVMKETGQLNQCSSQLQIHYFPQSFVVPRDAEVPSFVHK